MEQRSPTADPLIPFVEARHYLRDVPRTLIDLIVLHSMEAPEKGTRAEACARYFANLPPTRKASAHYCVDSDSIVQCVPHDRVAYHAPGANARGIGIEHAGYARQSRAEWLDDFGVAMLTRSAALTATLCKRWSIRAAFVDAVGLLAGHRGITTHAEVSRAFKRSTHWDPGPHFPMDWYIARVAEHMAS